MQQFDPTRNLDDAQRLARAIKKQWMMQGLLTSNGPDLWIEMHLASRPGTTPVKQYFIRSNYDPFTGAINDHAPAADALVVTV